MNTGTRILVVDDEPNIVIPLKFLMEKNGYSVSVAETGEEALKLAVHDRPDLILLDVMLPVIDGYEVCEAVRKNPATRNIKIVFITALGSSVEMVKSRVVGADAYIKKPFANSEVLETVRKLLGQPG